MFLKSKPLLFWYTDFAENTEKEKFLNGFSVKISEIRGVRVQKKKLRNSLLGWLPVLVACWMKKGCQQRIPTPGQQQWRHIFGAYNWATDEVVFQIAEKRNSDAFISFLDHLVEQHAGERPLVLILDNGSIHHSLASQAAFAVLEDRLIPMFLPKYCSQLNPIERFWKYLKATACANQLFPDMDALVASVKKVLASQNDIRASLRFSFLKNFS